MLRLTVDFKENSNIDEYLTQLKKDKRVEQVNIDGKVLKKKAAKSKAAVKKPKPEGPRLTMTEFKKRIKQAEKDIKEGRFYTQEQMKKEMDRWMEAKGIK